MFRVVLTTFAMVVGFSILHPIFAQTSNLEKQPWPQLESVFRDDFSMDSRNNYEIKGDVKWEPGKLTMAGGSSIQRTIKGGAWAKLELDVEWPDLSGDRPQQEVRIWFTFQGATNCFIRFRQELKAEQPFSSVAVVDTNDETNEQVVELVRESSAEALLPSSLVVEYRYGLVSISSDEKLLLTAYIENENATCQSQQIEVQTNTVRLSGIASLVCKDNTAHLTKSEIRTLDETYADYDRLLRIFDQGDYDQAVRIGNQILKSRVNITGKKTQPYAAILCDLAQIHEMLGNFEEAEKLYSQGIEIRKRVLGKRHPDYATALSNAGLLYESLGRYSDAETYHLEARRIHRNAFGSEHPRYATELCNLALLHKAMGKYDTAESLFLGAIGTLEKELNDNQSKYYYAAAINNLALLYELLHEYSKAEPMYLKARKILVEIYGKDHPECTSLTHNLGSLYESMGRFAEAEKLYIEVEKADKINLGENHPAYAMSLNSLASIYKSLEEYPKAESYFKRAMAVLRNYGEEYPDYATSIGNLASLYASTGSVDKAIALNNDALKIEKKVLGEEHLTYACRLGDQAMLFLSIGETAKAQALFEMEFEAKVNISKRVLGSFSEAQALTWMRFLGPTHSFVLNGLRSSKQEKAAAAYSLAWETKSATSRYRVGQSINSIKNVEAQEVFRKLHHARLQLARLVSATPSSNAEHFRNELQAATDAKERLEKRLATINPLTKYELAVRDAEIAKLLGKLPAKTVIVDFMRATLPNFDETIIELKDEDGSTERRVAKKLNKSPVYDAFILRSDTAHRLQWIELGNASRIDKAIASWRLEITGERNLETNLLDAPTLIRQLIWEKLEPHLDGCKEIIILPDGELHKMPWAAIPGSSPGSFVIDDYSISTANYGQQVFGLLSQQNVAPKRLLVAGGINYDVTDPARSPQYKNRSLDLAKKSRNWSSLVAARDEAKSVAKLWQNQGESVQLYGVDASESETARELQQCSHAHLATHGFFDKANDVFYVNLRRQSLLQKETVNDSQIFTVAARNPLLMSGIVLAGANLGPEKDDLGLPIGKDGILTAEEIVGLDLRNLDLVTLSACETGPWRCCCWRGSVWIAKSFSSSGGSFSHLKSLESRRSGNASPDGRILQ